MTERDWRDMPPAESSLDLLTRRQSESNRISTIERDIMFRQQQEPPRIEDVIYQTAKETQRIVKDLAPKIERLRIDLLELASFIRGEIEAAKEDKP